MKTPQDTYEKAARLKEMLSPFCEKIEIAGSIRRKRENPKDIEIVCVPWASDEGPLFESGFFTWMRMQKVFDLIPPGKLPTDEAAFNATRGYGVRGNEKYMRGIWGPSMNDVKIDFFITTRNQWGNILLIRTGSNFFTQAVMGYAKRIKKRFQGGWVTDENEQRTDQPDERELFTYLGLNWIEPQDRCPEDLTAAYRLLEENEL